MHLWVNGFGVSILSPKVIVSKYGPLPLLNGLWGVKGTSKSPWKGMAVGISLFSRLIHCLVGDGEDTFFWRINGWGMNSSTYFFLIRTIYPGHIPCFSLLSILFFARYGLDSQVIDIVPFSRWLDSLLYIGRRYVRICSPFPFGGFSCKSFFCCLVNPFPSSGSIFATLWKVNIPKMVKFCMQFVIISHKIEKILLIKEMLKYKPI